MDKGLFSTYALNIPGATEGEEEEWPSFQLNLAALLETLQIFGAVDVAARAQKAEQEPYRSGLRNYRPDAFSNQALGISGTCCLVYAEEGAPFSVIMEEAGVKTTANVVTYVAEIPEAIPFDRDDLAFKIITQARFLLDSLNEIAPFAPKRLRITATKQQPYLTLKGVGDMGTSSSDFARARDLLETFAIQDTWSQTYRFDLVKVSADAMRIASKVSFRGDQQGVLSLQFMVEVEGGGPSFLDFRFVPYGSEEGGSGSDEDEDNADETE